MKIRIKTKYLVESPYQKESDSTEQPVKKPGKANQAEGTTSTEEANTNTQTSKKEEDIWQFNKQRISSLADEIINSNSTSLLISGFRGVGKTSFIHKLQELVTTAKTNENIIFVKLNFSKYEEYKYTIRKLIRNLFLEIEKSPYWPRKKGFKQQLIRLWNKIPFVKKWEVSHQLGKTECEVLESLYANTYLKVSEQLTIKKERSEKTSAVSKFTSGTIPKVLGLIIASGGSLVLFMQASFLKYSSEAAWVLLLFALYQLFDITYTVTITNANTRTSQIDRTSLYDDEIADYLFGKVIAMLKENHIRVVFVLDELDKIQKEADINKVINELKPVLLSGDCNYILVSGQDLYYQYFKSSTENDPVISSIFSRFHHVELPTNSLTRLDNIIVLPEDGEELSREEQDFIYDFKHALIFDAHRLPRRLISVLRKAISPYSTSWEEDVAVVEMPVSDRRKFVWKSKMEAAISDTVEALAIDDVVFENKPITDLFIDQFYMWANEIVLLEEKEEYDYEVLLNKVEPWATKLPRLAKKREIFLITFLNDMKSHEVLDHSSHQRKFIVHWGDVDVRVAEPVPPPDPFASGSSGVGATAAPRPSVTPPVPSNGDAVGPPNEADGSTDPIPITAMPDASPPGNFEVDDYEAENDLDESLILDPVTTESDTGKSTGKSKAKSKPKQTKSSIELKTFVDAFHTLLVIGSQIKDAIFEINQLNFRSVDQIDTLPELNSNFPEEILGLASAYSGINDLVATHDFEGLFDDYIEATSGSAPVEVPSDFAVRITRLKTGLLKEFFAHLIWRNGINAELTIHAEETVYIANGRVPNLDIFIEIPDSQSHIALNFKVLNQLGSVDHTVLEDGLDFFMRLNKTTQKTTRLFLVFLVEQAGTDIEAYENKLMVEMSKLAPNEMQFVSFAFLHPEDTDGLVNIYKEIRTAARERFLFTSEPYFNARFVGGKDSQLNFFFTEDGSFITLKGDPGKSKSDGHIFWETRGDWKFKNPTYGTPHLKIVFYPGKEQNYQFTLVLDTTSEVHEQVSLCLVGDNLKEPVGPFEWRRLFKQPMPRDDRFHVYDINILREFQNTFWNAETCKLKKIGGLMIQGDVDVLSASIYYDENDTGFEEIDLIFYDQSKPSKG